MSPSPFSFSVFLFVAAAPAPVLGRALARYCMMVDTRLGLKLITLWVTHHKILTYHLNSTCQKGSGALLLVLQNFSSYYIKAHITKKNQQPSRVKAKLGRTHVQTVSDHRLTV